MMPGERAKNFGKTMRQLMRYLQRYNKMLLVSMLLAVASTVFSIAGPKIMAGATDTLTKGVLAMVTGTGGIDFAAMGQTLLFCLGIYVISALLQFVQGFLLTGMSNKISYSMRNQISEKINRLPLAYFDKASYGDVLSVVSNDVDTLVQTLNQSLPQMISSVTTLIGVTVMMFSINVWMTLITLLILPVAMLLITLIIKKSQPYFKRQQKYLGSVNGRVEEDYSGHLVLKAFNC